MSNDAPKKGCCHRCCRNCPMLHLFAFLIVFVGFIFVLVNVDNVLLGLKTMGLDLKRFSNEMLISAAIIFVVNVLVVAIAFITTDHCREKLCHKSDNCCVKGCQCFFGQFVQLLFALLMFVCICLAFALCCLTAGLGVISALTDASCDFNYTLPVGGEDVNVLGDELIGPMFENAKHLLPEAFSTFEFETTGMIICGENTTFVYWPGDANYKYDPGHDFFYGVEYCFIGAVLMLFGQIFMLIAVVATYKNIAWEQAVESRKKPSPATEMAPVAPAEPAAPAAPVADPTPADPEAEPLKNDQASV